MPDAHALRVVVAGGTGRLGTALAPRLASDCEVRLLTPSAGVDEGDAPGQPGVRRWSCDLLSIPDTEVALAGADVLVYLAQVSRPPARLVQADREDLELLMADAVARAAPRTSVRRLVLFARGPDDPREAVLRRSGLPLTVLRGGGPDPVAALADLVRADASSTEPERLLPAWTPEPRGRLAPRQGVLVCSVQRFECPRGWSARDVADGYFTWLTDALPLVKAQRLEQNVVVRTTGLPVLMLRHAPGASEDGSVTLDVHDGLLVGRGAPATLEFRVVGADVFVVLNGFTPALPWPVFRATQALIHSSTMKRFGRWLESQAPRAEAA